MTRVRALLLLLTVGLAATLISACGGGSSAIQKVDASAFLAQAAKPATVVIDVRTPSEYAAGHLEGAINIDVEGTTFDAQVAKLPKTDTYEVYCHSGRRSSMAADKLASAGFTHIYNLSGGIADLQAAGGKIVV